MRGEAKRCQHGEQEMVFRSHRPGAQRTSAHRRWTARDRVANHDSRGAVQRPVQRRVSRRALDTSVVSEKAANTSTNGVPLATGERGQANLFAPRTPGLCLENLSEPALRWLRSCHLSHVLRLTRDTADKQPLVAARLIDPSGNEKELRSPISVGHNDRNTSSIAEPIAADGPIWFAKFRQRWVHARSIVRRATCGENDRERDDEMSHQAANGLALSRTNPHAEE